MVFFVMTHVEDQHKHPIDQHHNIESKRVPTIKVQILHPKYTHQHNQIYQIHIHFDIAIGIIRLPIQHSPIKECLHKGQDERDEEHPAFKTGHKPFPSCRGRP